MIDTTINLLVNRTECTNLSGTTLTLRLAVKSDNSSPAILFRDSEKLDATIKLSLTLPTTTLKMHQRTKLCQLRLCTCLSPTLLHSTPTMQTLFAKYSLVWLTTTINHCQRIFQHQPKKDRMPHNSSPHGSILGIVIALLLEVANTRHVSASTQTSSQQSNNCSRCFSSSNMLKGSSSLKPTFACKKKNIVLSVMGSSFVGLACGSSWQQSTVQI